MRFRLSFSGVLLLSSPVVACSQSAPAPLQRHENGDDSVFIGGGVFETAEDAKLRKDRIAAVEIGRSLESLSGVVRARVHLTTPSHSILTPQSTEESGAAVVLVRDNDTHPTEAEVRAFVAAAAPSLSSDSIKVFVSTETVAPPELVRVGPIDVSEASALNARILLGALLGLCLVAAAGLILAGVKLRKMRKMS